MFEKELKYFISNQNELLQKHLNKILVIKNEEIIGVYDSPLEAYIETQKEYELGTFFIQPCQKGPEAYTVTLNSHKMLV
jgi:hypothetical protein